MSVQHKQERVIDVKEKLVQEVPRARHVHQANKVQSAPIELIPITSPRV